MEGKRCPLHYLIKVLIAAVPAILIAAGIYVGATVWTIGDNMTNSEQATKLIHASDTPVVEKADADVVIAPRNELKSDFHVLLLGVDSSENRENGDEAGLYEGTFRSDSIILAHVNTDTKHVSLCSMHRDLLTDIDGYEGELYKLNAAYALGGVALMKKEVEQLTGIDDIPFYAVVDMDGLREIIDGVGGIEIDVEEAFYDDVLMSGIPQKGYQTLNGNDALVYARSRYAWDELGYVGDTARAKHQRQVLQSLASKFTHLDPVSMMNCAEMVSHHVATNMTINQMIEIATKMTGMDTQKDIYSFMTPTGGLYLADQWFEELMEDAWALVLADFNENNGIKMSEVDEYGTFLHIAEVNVPPSQWKSRHDDSTSDIARSAASSSTVPKKLDNADRNSSNSNDDDEMGNSSYYNNRNRDNGNDSSSGNSNGQGGYYNDEEDENASYDDGWDENVVVDAPANVDNVDVGGNVGGNDTGDVPGGNVVDAGDAPVAQQPVEVELDPSINNATAGGDNVTN